MVQSLCSSPSRTVTKLSVATLDVWVCLSFFSFLSNKTLAACLLRKKGVLAAAAYCQREGSTKTRVGPTVFKIPAMTVTLSLSNLVKAYQLIHSIKGYIVGEMCLND